MGLRAVGSPGPGLVFAVAIIEGSARHASAQDHLVPELGSVNDHPTTIALKSELDRHPTPKEKKP